MPSTCMRLYCDNTTAIHICRKSNFSLAHQAHEMDCHLVRYKVAEDKTIELQHVSSINQLAEMLTKPLRGSRIRSICDK